MAFGIDDALMMVGGQVLSGIIQSDSAENAANIQGRASDAAVGEQRAARLSAERRLAPYEARGNDAGDRLSELMGLGGTGPGGRKSYRSILDRITADYDAQHRAKYGVGLMESPDQSSLSSVLNQLNSQARNEFDAQPVATETSADEFGGSPLLRKFTLSDFWKDPVTQASFQFGLDQGTQAIDRMAGARGGRNSGATLKALTRFGTDYTGGQAAGSQARFTGDQTNVFNRLSGVAGTGQQAATNTAQIGTNSATNIGNIMTAQGNARGAAAIAGGNAWGGAANNIGNWWNQQKMVDALKNRGGYGTPPFNPAYGFDG